MIRQKLPIEVAKAVLEKSKIKKAPVDIEGLIMKYNIKLYQKESLPDDIAGILDVTDKNNAKIFVNELHSPERQRFSMAHELGHFLMHNTYGTHVDKRTFFRDKNSQTALDPIEIEANRFAAEILMPWEFIKKDLSEYEDILDEKDDVIEVLAKKFKVSVTAMSIRFQSLGYSF